MFYNVVMKVGIRDLKQNASAIVRRAEGGESVDITNRGRVVARIVPVKDDESPLERMKREGKITPGKGNLWELEPLPPDPSKPTLSEILEQMRSEERY